MRETGLVGENREGKGVWHTRPEFMARHGRAGVA